MRIVSTKQAFTLIELMVVIVIMGVLATLVVASLISMRSKAVDARTISDIRNIQMILEQYANNEGNYPNIISFGNPLIGPTSGLTYSAKVPTPPKPVNNNLCLNSGYSYLKIPGKNQYILRYCLNGQVSNCPAGFNDAVPTLICQPCQDSGFNSPNSDHCSNGVAGCGSGTVCDPASSTPYCSNGTCIEAEPCSTNDDCSNSYDTCGAVTSGFCGCLPQCSGVDSCGGDNQCGGTCPSCVLTELGPNPVSPAIKEGVAIAVNPATNQPWIVYSEEHPSNKSMVKKYNNNQWEFVSDSTSGLSTKINHPNIIFNSSTAYISGCLVDGAGGNIGYYTYNSSWSSANSNYTSSWHQSYPDVTCTNTQRTPIVVDSHGNVYISGQLAVIRKYNGSWTSVELNRSTVSSPYQALAIDSSDNLYFSYHDNNSIKIDKNSTNLGGSFGSYTSSWVQDLVLSSSGQPYLLSQKNIIQYYDGSNWNTAGNGSYNTDGTAVTAINFSNTGVLYVVYVQNNGQKLCLSKLVNNTWSNVFCSDSYFVDKTEGDTGGSVDLAFSNNNDLFIAIKGKDDKKVYVLRYGPQ